MSTGGRHLVVHSDFLHRGDGNFLGLRDNDRDGVAHVTDFFAAQHFLVAADQAVQVGAGNIFVGKHRDHAGQLLCFTAVNPENLGVRMGGPEHFGEEEFFIEQILAVLRRTRRFAKRIQAQR